ncbi:nitroreductase family protein [Hyphomicrobium sp. LHD-15]|uniref:nitroreductase family protein n=1 Tax=Hyphomicrobium sp. LHD-15 TaxID=3072142 RepID=UPI00280FC178|nr:nitroreductase family protein [Hyphomicrobium sp. LHD-15]MDQ8699857.1 nitroreductase family protein [Hyphomicrobium sp. LHD-15]
MALARQVLSRILPVRVYQALAGFRRRQQRLLQQTLRARAMKSDAFSAFYAFVIDRGLGREARAVAAGQHRYHADHDAAATSYFLLRRNIHRLEKGLIMRPRRDSFAADYIGETVRCYRNAYLELERTNRSETPELAWATDVLGQYFSVVQKDDPKIADAHEIFSKLAAIPLGHAVPYARDIAAPPPVSYDAFMSLCRRRRSVRWYLDKPVPRDMIDLAIDAAAQAPSACNRQPFVFSIFDDKELARRVAKLPMGTKGFSDQIPAVAVVIGRLRAYPHSRDRHAIYIDGSLAAMSFMLALESMGIASCTINWPDQNPQETQIAQLLGLAQDERVIMLIAFGWPDPSGQVPYSAKRGRDELRTYNSLATQTSIQ